MITLTPRDALPASELHPGQAHLQAWTLQSSLASTIATMSSSRELPMPHISRISSLNQAQATLMVCLTKLTKFTQEQAAAASFAWSPTSLGNERQTFQDWLQRWEIAFHAFLATTVPIAPMTNEDMTLSRILKANHLACSILASDGMTTGPSESDLQPIVRLAEAVLEAQATSDSPRDAKSDRSASATMTGLGVRQPLLVVRSRCRDKKLRARVDELLGSASW